MKKWISTLITILVITFQSATSQQFTGTIKGKITTADNKPAEGVTILIKNSSKHAVADNGGLFEIKNMLPGEHIILVSLVGYQDAEEKVLVESGRISPVSIQLGLSDKELNEVVVIANKNHFKTNRLSGSLRLQSPILEIPQNIQVVTARLINDQQIFDMLEGVTRKCQWRYQD